ncbi:GcvT family protein [Rhodococcus sp. MEB064]|uniref:GcvT family protein n=1 Tax=Rhodococcus sp. MEB064 TaxID=1587522 RepID=UPI0005AD08D2|nr:FAD-dependent oxidoreductase [Rhodococcus sp. MEB064]KIQ20637.1 sarcosine dehydrogenase [Rhodococcus sp. MEB064]
MAPRTVTPHVVVIGAGIVGTSLADELTMRGWCNVTVLDQGPLFSTGGSTSHAPGLVFQTNPSRSMAHFASYTADKFRRLTHEGEPCFDTLGGLEVATTPARWADLQRKAGWARSWGIDGHLVDSATAAELHPLLDRDRVLGAFHTPTDGLARAVRAAAAQAAAATARGAVFRGHSPVTEILTAGGRVTGVRTPHGDIAADIVVSAAGFWGAELGRTVGLTVPLVPMAHQYAYTGRIDALVGRNHGDSDASLPILRHQDGDLYYREHGDRIGIGYYGHDPMPADMSTLSWADDGDSSSVLPPPMPSMLPFTEDDFAPAWLESTGLLPALGDSKVESGFNGIFSFTPDGQSIVGEHRDLAGFWVAEAVWVTHSAGIARAVAQTMIDGSSEVDLHESDLYRFEAAERSPAFIATTSAQAFVEVYDVIHPRQQRSALRGLRRSPFHAAEVALGAEFVQGGAWERPAWYESNRSELDDLVARGMHIPARDEWSARHFSDIAVAEAVVTRSRVAMFDMTPLTRYDVEGPGAAQFLQDVTTNNVDTTVGRVTYTLVLDDNGGVRSDLTVARLAPDHYRVGANGPLDLDWLTRRARETDGAVTVRDVTGATCCIGVWGPRARDVVAPVADADLSHTAFGYFRAVQTYLGAVPVTMLRVSYVGELGWEIYTDAEYGGALWDLLWDCGTPHGVIAAGRLAFDSLRLEKGYRAWGHDMTSEHTPIEAGVEFAVKSSKDFVGKAALATREATQRLRTLVFDDADSVVLGKEPVSIGDSVVGYVTSAGWSATIGRCIAYAWLPIGAEPGAAVTVSYFDRQYDAVVAEDAVVDPAGHLIRR